MYVLRPYYFKLLYSITKYVCTIVVYLGGFWFYCYHSNSTMKITFYTGLWALEYF